MPRVHPKSNEDGEIEGMSATSTPNQGQSARKKHVCPTCERCFTTSGHLARHSRVHTGEKNHKCPFPGCDTRCSRQDNLQQHYRIHLSPGSRRTSSRSASSRRGRRATTTSDGNTTPASQQDYNIASDQPPLSPPPLVPATVSTPSLSPPPLEPARAPGADARYSPPPDSPPPLAHATISGPYPHAQRASPTSSATSSPDAASFQSADATLRISPPTLASVHSSTSAHSNGYSFRTGATYQEHPGNNAGYSYGQNASPVSETYSQATSEGYSNGQYSLPRIDTLTSVKDDSAVAVPSTSLTGVNSRHSISHISHSHPQSAYPRMMSSSMNSRPSTGPPSPASSHSTSHSVVSHSGPPTPNGYTNYDADGSQSSPYDQTSPLSNHSGGSILEPSLSRYSPPPVLAPIHGFTSHESMEAISRSGRVMNEQYERRPSIRDDYSDRYAHYETRYVPDEPRYGRHVYGVAQERQAPVQTYMPHQPSSMANFHDMYSPGGVSLHHGAWKSEQLTNRGMKSINALVQ
ncbi:hypothetical protein F5050DRAFT_1729719 [Lentinula boryana]|uniref:C2H2-type domain-containing protein n=1 Tax=Lentinula boryana TaxID=40481 RepID=A0ABQ8QPX4_9AGAR|nr:hypothetical protein F5050DRAFT_1729719 [Lentinula boryana]